ncbi:glycosyltransferase family 2 protein [Mucilaginibacter rubeus]|uniref:Glycosyltransferase n=1 Tax=Mucilaginibacter rubeus TaxID=2027860 RepID=A0A5C1I0T8_9SPHI|nr:glycosyltransferase family 2 protein [Mucilaginibacter rubeus]QEM11419.1 glycosyltransferase [Mucilaginibacter rubeus]
MNLPDLKKYREDFIAAGVNLPLQVIPSGGLLKVLPAPDNQYTGWPWTEETDPKVYRTNNNWPKLTIVTPSYNQGRFIEQTIRSILLQNYPNLEYIVIDGGSNDETVSILEKYAPWISYYRSAKDNGQGQAINLGFSLASGDYYAWINSDDYYLKDVFHEVIQLFTQSKTKFVYGYGLNYRETTQQFDVSKVLPSLDFFLKIPNFVQPSSFWSATIHQPIWEKLHCALDFELWLRLVKGQKRKLIKKPLSVANIHDTAKTSDAKMKMKWDEDEKLMWSNEGHGAVPHWGKVNFINRIRIKIYRSLGLI